MSSQCYQHKCEFCDETIPIHIYTFDYPGTWFHCFCYRHIKYAPIGSVIFTLKYPSEPDYPRGWKCAIFGPEVPERNGINFTERWYTTMVVDKKPELGDKVEMNDDGMLVIKEVIN